MSNCNTCPHRPTEPRDTRAERSAQILDAALQVARAGHYHTMTREQVAVQAGVSTGLVSRYMGTALEMRERVMQAAIERRILPLIATGIALGDAVALAAPAELRAEAVATLV